jgi:uncharacterized protein (DUF885 family)
VRFTRLRPFALFLAAITITLVPLLAEAAAPPSGDADARFKAIWTQEWAWRQKEMPQRNASPIGGLPHADAATQERHYAYWTNVLKQLQAVPQADLSPEQQVNYTVYLNQIQNLVDTGRFRAWEMPFNSDSAFWSEVNSSGRRTFQTEQDYKRYLVLMSDVPRYFHENIDNMRAGIKRNFTVPQVTLAGRDVAIASVADVKDPQTSTFYDPFKKMPTSIPPAEQAALRAEAVKTIQQSVIPAYAELLKFFNNEYVPNARKTLAADSLPDGKEFYQSEIRRYTTLDLTPDQIHKIGLAEVDRIHAEMIDVMQSTGYKGDFHSFLEFLRTDPQFKFDKPEYLLWYGAWVVNEVNGKIGDYIGLLPRGRFSIKPVPDSIAPFYTAGRGGAGSCLLNTYDLPSRPSYNLTALTLHECMPGHAFHFLILAEQKGRPDFWRASQISAFSEGWALYDEKLGVEMGIYKTPYDNFGRLTYEIWRACRLVIDTGIHSQGWTREQALDYLRQNTALPEHEIDTAVDRYISWPAQALSYKLGEMQIVELRKQAEERLGPKFNVRSFHDALLGMGVVPLPVMRQQMEKFIQSGGIDPVLPAPAQKAP